MSRDSTVAHASCLAQTGEDDLAQEGRVFGRYLIGRDPAADLIARYGAASRTIFPNDPPPEDAALVAFARRRPWSIACLDGACALRRPSGLLRGKLLVMSAICEAATGSGDAFIPRVVPVPVLMVRLAVAGAAAVLQAGVGLAMYPFVVRCMK